MPRRATRRGLVRQAAAGVALGALTRTATANTTGAVDLELVLAVDCSLSIDDEEYRLQAEGTASAFTDSAVIRAITGGPSRAIAVAYVEWAGPHEQRVIVPWRRIDSAASGQVFASELRRLRRFYRGDATSIGSAIDYCARLFAAAGASGPRRVIDISSDGISNAGRIPPRARDDAVARGITINALPILSEYAGLDGYFRDEVIGGPGAFVLPAPDFSAFAQAIRAKLIRELS
jgi:hypothetical protein